VAPQLTDAHQIRQNLLDDRVAAVCRRPEIRLAAEIDEHVLVDQREAQLIRLHRSGHRRNRRRRRPRDLEGRAGADRESGQKLPPRVDRHADSGRAPSSRS
jgi:hypothetical protein